MAGGSLAVQKGDQLVAVLAHLIGHAVSLQDLEPWLRLYFGLPPDRRVATVVDDRLVLANEP